MVIDLIEGGAPELLNSGEQIRKQAWNPIILANDHTDSILYKHASKRVNIAKCHYIENLKNPHAPSSLFFFFFLVIILKRI